MENNNVKYWNEHREKILKQDKVEIFINAWNLGYADGISRPVQAGVIKKNADGLLPCPFCGSEAGYNTYKLNDATPKLHHIYCANEDCLVEIHCEGYETKEECFSAWNKRG